MRGIPGQPTWMIEIFVKTIVAVQLILYTLITLKLYKSYLLQMKQGPCKDLSNYLSGIKRFAVSFIIMMALLIFHRFLHTSGDNFSSTLFILTLLILNIGLAYYGIHFEDNYLYECQHAAGNEPIVQSLNNTSYPKKAEPSGEDAKYNSSCMCKDLKVELVEKLLLLMKEDEPFTDSKVRIDDIADMVGTNTKYLSQLINEHFGKNFHTFLNDYRCSKVIKLFNDPHYNNYSIEGIAETCGFNSRSTFVASFKRFSGKLPSVYRSSVRAKMKK
jgi:AraC-like DNA-binding protein